LSLVNGNHTTTTYDFLTSKSGSVNVDGGVITYADLEQPINTTSAAKNAVFHLPANSAAVTLSELPEGGAELNGGAIVGARIVDPSQSLTVHGDNTDTISVAGTAPLTLSSAS